MKHYEVIVIGSGAGLTIVDAARSKGMSTALVDAGPVGGTCLNLGCIPSKLLIYPADVAAEIQEAGKLGITAEIQHIDFPAIMERMRATVHEWQQGMKPALEAAKDIDYYDGTGRFVGNHVIEVNGTKIKGTRIFIVSGTRPLIPPIPGLESTPFLTNETLLDLTEKPESMIIIGGGYIATEFGHFFAGMGTAVTMLEMGPRLVSNEEPEISALLERELGKRMAVHTHARVVEVKKSADGVTVVAEDAQGTQRTFTAATLLVAAGRASNADILDVAKTGVKTNADGSITVNEFLETTAKHIWAAGDANGAFLFRHMANREVAIAWHNATHGGHGNKVPVDYSAVPHAIFTRPQIASVGLTEAQARDRGHDILVGIAKYADVTKGTAMMDETSFAKAVVAKEDGAILGFHIIGPYAPILIQSVINIMAIGGTVNDIAHAIHIHPALPEVIQAALGNLHEP